MRVSKIGFDKYGKWLMEGHPIKMIKKESDRRDWPQLSPWNLGVFDAIVVADKMVATPGEAAGCYSVRPAGVI